MASKTRWTKLTIRKFKTHLDMTYTPMSWRSFLRVREELQRWSSGFKTFKDSSISNTGVFITTRPSSHTPMHIAIHCRHEKQKCKRTKESRCVRMVWQISILKLQTQFNYFTDVFLVLLVNSDLLWGTCKKQFKCQTLPFSTFHSEQYKHFREMIIYLSSQILQWVHWLVALLYRRLLIDAGQLFLPGSIGIICQTPYRWNLPWWCCSI